MNAPTSASLDGGCPCMALRFRLLCEPLFVHACHCRNCQRETGAPFAHHAVIESRQFALLQGTPDRVALPSSSGRLHRLARCPGCGTGLWNEWGRGPPVTLYVRVGSLDEPGRAPPRAHIYTRSRQPWVNLQGGAPGFKTGYDAATLWPAASLERLASARTSARTSARATARPAKPPKAKGLNTAPQGP